MPADSKPLIIEPATFSPRGEEPGKQPYKARPIQIAIGSALLLFALSLWFLFTARSVLFSFDPDYAELDIDGGLHLQLGERYLLRSGDYQLRVVARGHYELLQEITVGEEDSQVFALALQRLPGLLSFSTVPAGAQIVVEDQSLGVTPLLDVPVAAGEHNLRVLAERYLPHREDIEVTGMEQAQEFTFTLQPAWANIAISSVPVGATVYVDGEALASTPALLEILEGEHQISLQMHRYSSWQQTLSVSAGVHQNLQPIVLRAAEGVLSLSSSPSGANVTVDGEFSGQTPLQLSLEPDHNHRIAIFKPGYSRAERSVSLQPEENRELRLTLQPQMGDVQVTVQPASAEVFVDNQLRGRGNQTLTLPAYAHTLEVKLPGYRNYRQPFTPKPGIKQEVLVFLLTESEARLAELEAEITSPGGQILRLYTPGDFTMGASRREPGRRANEVLHPVSLNRLFYLATREVTNLEYRKFLKQHSSGSVEGNSLNRDQQPVAALSWDGAALYCNWLSEQAKLPPFYQVEAGKVIGFNVNSTGYRLPSEAEWAWAARVKGSTLLKFPWGDSFPPTQVLENYADGSSAYITGRTVPHYEDGQIVSAPVGSFAANHLGLYDMGGNVAEWVHDVYAIPGSSGVAEVNPLGAQQGRDHVIRGASWAQGTVTELRLSFRDYGNEGRDDVGFRVARYAEEAP